MEINKMMLEQQKDENLMMPQLQKVISRHAQQTADAEIEQAGASLEFVTGSPSSHSCANAAIVDDPMTQPLQIPLRSKSLERRGAGKPLIRRPPSSLEDSLSAGASCHEDRDKSPRRQRASSFNRGQVFTEAETKIIPAGKEVAVMKESLLREQQQVAVQQQAQAIAWANTQARIEAEEKSIADKSAEVLAHSSALQADAQLLESEKAQAQDALASSSQYAMAAVQSERLRAEQTASMARLKEKEIEAKAKHYDNAIESKECDLRSREANLLAARSDLENERSSMQAQADMVRKLREDMQKEFRDLISEERQKFVLEETQRFEAERQRIEGKSQKQIECALRDQDTRYAALLKEEEGKRLLLTKQEEAKRDLLAKQLAEVETRAQNRSQISSRCAPPPPPPQVAASSNENIPLSAERHYIGTPSLPYVPRLGVRRDSSPVGTASSMAKADSAHSSFAAYAPVLEMMREMKAEMAELRAELCGVQMSETLTSRITPGAPVLGVASGSAHRVPPNAVGSRPSNNSSSSDEEENLSFSSSTIRQPAFDHSGKSSSGKPSDPHRSLTTVDLSLVSKSGKEAEEIKGIPPYPSIAEWGAWQRDVRYAVTSASSHPGAALDYVLSGESGIDPLELNADPNFETLGAKWAMSLRLIVRGELKRELSVLEEQILRTHHRLMDGRQIYSWINRKFQRDARLARPQILQELANCKIANTGFGALKDYLTRWDMCVERLIQAGAETSDREILYVHFSELHGVVRTCVWASRESQAQLAIQQGSLVRVDVRRCTLCSRVPTA